MRRLVVVLVSSALLLGSMPALLLGAQAPTSCSEAVLYLYEDHGLEGDLLTICSPENVYDLGNVGHPYPGLCKPKILPPDNWNDCISSVWFDEKSIDTAVCLYTNRAYSGSRLKIWSDWSGNLTGVWNDSFSSIKWGSNCP